MVGVEGGELSSAQEPPEVRHFTPGGVEVPVIRGLPARPARQYPIPYHRPGQQAKTALTNAENLAQAYGVSEPLTMTTALELGVLDVPFQGNHVMVNWDQILMVGPPAGASYVQATGLQAAALITTSPQLSAPVPLPGVWQEPAWPDQGAGAVVAGLNGDGWDESIAIYNDDATPHKCLIAVGSMGDLAGRVTSAPAVALFSEGGVDKLRAAVQGYDGGLWINTYDGAWGTWSPLGGNPSSAPAVAGGAGVADVYYLDTGGELLRIDTVNGLTETETLGAPPGIGLTLDPAAAQWGTRTDVFVRRADNALWHRARQGGAWSAWESLGGFLTSSPAAAWSSSSRLDVVARGYDGALWQRTYNGGAELALGTRRVELTRGTGRLHVIVAQSLGLAVVFGAVLALMAGASLVIGARLAGVWYLLPAVTFLITGLLGTGAYIAAVQVGGALTRSSGGALLFGIGFLAVDWVFLLAPTISASPGLLGDLSPYSPGACILAAASWGRMDTIAYGWQLIDLAPALLLLFAYAVLGHLLAVAIAYSRDA
ncbi:MAG: hypothetical protein JXA93_05290 [Anaerolineae bacterium]|nr:hypothetical protein [Anaerolineae bacterium]